MKAAAVPIPYIIAILLGVVIIVLVGYWLFVSGGQFGGGVSEATCRNFFIQYCRDWSRFNYAVFDPTQNPPEGACLDTNNDGEDDACFGTQPHFENYRIAVIGITGKGCDAFGITVPTSASDCLAVGA